MCQAHLGDPVNAVEGRERGQREGGPLGVNPGDEERNDA